MPHVNRQWQKNCYYHITSRSNWREPLFRSDEDFLCFLQLLEETNKKYPFQLVSYVLMKTHFHLLMFSNTQSYSNIMFLIKKKYATYFNKKYQTRGHLFEKRFFAKPASSPRTLLHKVATFTSIRLRFSQLNLQKIINGVVIRYLCNQVRIP